MMANEPMTDRQLEVLAKEVALALTHGSLAPIATAMQSVAMADLAYLIDEYKRLRDANDALLTENERIVESGNACVELGARYQRERDALQAKLERLQSENAAMRPIVEAVAEHIGGYVSEHFRQCAFCGNGALESRVIAHANDCEVEQARAFVAAHPAAGEAVESEGE